MARAGIKEMTSSARARNSEMAEFRKMGIQVIPNSGIDFGLPSTPSTYRIVHVIAYGTPKFNGLRNTSFKFFPLDSILGIASFFITNIHLPKIPSNIPQVTMSRSSQRHHPFTL